MPTHGRAKQIVGLVIISLLLPGGIPLGLTVLVAGHIWPGRFRAFAPGKKETS